MDHTSVCDILFDIVQSPALHGQVRASTHPNGSRKEVPVAALLERNGGRGRQDDDTEYRADLLLVYPGRAGIPDERCELVDVTISDPQPEKSGRECSSDPTTNVHGTAAADAAESEMVNHYSARFLIPPGGNTTIVPFGADTHGALGPSATSLLNKLASLAFPPTTVEVGGEVRLLSHPSRAQFLRQMKARLGTAIIRSRAEVVRRWALVCVPPEYLPESTRSAIASKLRASWK